MMGKPRSVAKKMADEFRVWQILCRYPRPGLHSTEDVAAMTGINHRMVQRIVADRDWQHHVADYQRGPSGPKQLRF